MGTRPVVLIAATLLALTAGTCSNDDDADDGSAPTTTTLSPEAEVEAAYLAYWDMFVRLTQSPDPSDPEIEERASGAALLQLSEGLAGLRDRQQAAEFGPLYAHDVLSVEIEGERATVRDCAVDDSHLVDLTTGEARAGDVATDLWEATLIQSDSGWLVDSVESVRAIEGAASCD